MWTTGKQKENIEWIEYQRDEVSVVSLHKFDKQI
jgi:hypothetical protein